MNEPFKIKHILLPGYELAELEIQPEETITSFLERTEFQVDRLPTICVVNGTPILRQDWATTTISLPDRAEFWSKPYGGGGSGSKTASIIGLLGVLALAVIAPWAAGMLFTAGSFGFFATVAAITVGGGMLLSSFLTPKPADNSAKNSDVAQLYSLSASGNTATPLQVIPVQYGKLKVEPVYASIPWSEYIGDDMYLNITLCQGMGKYHVHQLLIDDTLLWDETTGFSDTFTGVTTQFCAPGEALTLFPANVVSSSEVSSQTVTYATHVGPFVLNAAGTVADAVAFDFILPVGLFSTNDTDSDLHSATVELVCEVQEIDNVGTPIGDWDIIVDQIITLNTRSPKRFTFKAAVTPGRYQGRVHRTTAESTDTHTSDSVQWAGFRAFLEGSNLFPNVSIVGVRILATNQLTQGSSAKLGVIQTRILPVWNGSTFVDTATRNPLWAFYDCATNTVYGAKQALSKIDFQTIVTQASNADTRGDSFNFVFNSAVTFQAAFDTILASVRSKTSWIGDILSIMRDEWKPIPQMLLTDQQTIRGSLSIDYVFNDDTQSDCVVGQLLNENTWGPAQLQYPPNSLSFTGLQPTTVQLDGITDPAHMYRELQFLYNQSQLRRIQVRLETEHDGRLLRFGSVIKVQSNLPTKWGQSGEVLFYNDTTKILTVDKSLIFTPATTHYIEMRDKKGSYFGPVAVGVVSGHPNQCQVNATDLAVVEAQLGTTLDATLVRMDGAEPPAYAFGIAGSLSRNCIILTGQPQGDKVSLSMTIDSEAVHNVDGSGTPIQPTAPVLVDPRVPIVLNLAANFRQGVAEPILDASWWPAVGAFYYRAQVSYDGGVSWIALPDTQTPTLSQVVSRAGLRLRVSAVNNMHGPWSTTDVEAPTIVIGDDTVAPSSLIAGLQDYVMRRLQETADRTDKVAQLIASVAAEHDASSAIATSGIKTAVTSITGSINDRITAEVDTITTAVTSVTDAFAVYQITVAVQFGNLTSQVNTVALAAANANSSIASLTNTVTAGFNSVNATTTTLAQAIATSDGRFAAAFTLSLDVNHYVSGFKSVNDGSFSSFTIISDVFQVSNPGVSGGAPRQIFQVGTVNGSTELVLKGNLFADGVIFSRMIQTGEVKTINLAAQSVTAAKVATKSLTANEIAAGTISSDSGLITHLGVKSISIGDQAVIVPVVQVLSAPAGSGTSNSFNVVIDTTGLAGKIITLLILYDATANVFSNQPLFTATLFAAGVQIASAPISLSLSVGSGSLALHCGGVYSYNASGGVDTIPVRCDVSVGPGCSIANRALFAQAVKR